MKKGLSSLDKNAGFVSGILRAARGISKSNIASNATGFTAAKNHAFGLGKNVIRYSKRNPAKATVGGLASYGGYKAIGGGDNGVTINNY